MLGILYFLTMTTIYCICLVLLMFVCAVIFKPAVSFWFITFIYFWINIRYFSSPDFFCSCLFLQLSLNLQKPVWLYLQTCSSSIFPVLFGNLRWLNFALSFCPFVLHFFSNCECYSWPYLLVLSNEIILAIPAPRLSHKKTKNNFASRHIRGLFKATYMKSSNYERTKKTTLRQTKIKGLSKE